MLSNPAAGATYDDWFEIYNSNSSSVNLSGWKIVRTDTDLKEKTYEFTQTIAAKRFLTVEKAESFGIGKKGGDVLRLYDAKGALVDSVVMPAQKGGHSYGRVPDGGRAWQDFSDPTKGATNGGVDPELPTETSSLAGTLYINEVVSKPGTDTDADWIEIYNASDAAVNIGGLALEDEQGVVEKFTIPSGTTIPAHGFATYTQDETNSFTFGLASKGEDVYLVDGSNKFIDHVTLPDMSDYAGYSYARTYDASATWAITASPTKNASNGSAGVGTLKADTDANLPTYNLQGIRVTSPRKGIYIRGGKKFVVK